MLFQHIEDLHSYGKPAGWGAVWQNDTVRTGDISDPFIMTGFDKKILHLKNEGGESLEVSIEVDFLGNETWEHYKSIELKRNEYKYHIFPDGFSAHWVRLKINGNSVVTAQFVYN